MARIRGRLQRALGPRPGGRVVSVRSRRQNNNGGDREEIQRRLDQQTQDFNQGQEQRFRGVNRFARKAAKRARKQQRKALRANRRVGRQERADIRASGERLGATAEQGLIDRGLGNTTVRSSVQRGVREDTMKGLSRAREAQALREIGIRTGAAGLETNLGQFGVNTLLSRQDQPPNASVTLDLLRRLGGA